MKRKHIDNFIWNWYYAIIYIACLYSIYNLSFQVGTLSVVVMAFLIIIKPSIFFSKVDHSDYFLINYVLWCIISYVWSVGNNKFENFSVSFGYTLMPCCFFFWAKRIKKKDSDLWIQYFINVTFWAMVIGLILYIWQPEPYREFLAIKSYAPSSSLYNTQKWFSGIFGPTVIGSLCTIAATYELQKYFKGNKNSLYKFFWYSVLLIMSARKSALAMYIVVSGYIFFVKGFFIQKNLFKSIIGLGLGLSFILFLWDRYPSIFNTFFDRFNSAEMQIGLSERNLSIQTALSKVQSIVIGNGFGMAGHRAGVYNGASAAVYDNSYMLVLCETGVIGLVLFIGFLFSVLNQALKNYRQCKIELIIAVILLVQAYTSNIFELLYLTPIFWFCLGRCSIVTYEGDNEEIDNKCQEKKLSESRVLLIDKPIQNQDKTIA